MDSLFSVLFDTRVPPILCIGDLMLDIFVEGSVERISPEAPIPVLKYKSEKEVLGGAGNVVRNLASLGIPSRLVALVGDDLVSQKIDGLLNQIPQIAPYLIKSPMLKTTQKTRFTAGAQQLLRVDRETPECVAHEHVKELLELIPMASKGVRTTIISDYGKGVLSGNLLQPLIAQGRVLGQFIMVDPKGKDYTIYSGVNLITPNREELSLATGLVTQTDEDCVVAALSLLEKCQIDSVLVTRGSQGMTFVQKDKEPIHIPAHIRDVFDVSGAGDTVVSVMAAGVNAGLTMEQTLKLANHAGGIVVGKVGTAPIEKEELLAMGDTHEKSQSFPSKILSLKHMCEKRAQWQRKGLTVGFTNGCFDLLHPGHIQLLKEAADRCDRLILGLNSDDSVKRLKGSKRPLQSQEDRAFVLAAMELVHGIVIFDEDTPLEVIKALQPDLLVKGADYTLEQIVGAQEVLGSGGKVHRVVLVPNKSTTRLANASQGAL